MDSFLLNIWIFHHLSLVKVDLEIIRAKVKKERMKLEVDYVEIERLINL
jgi:hypothetical protein